MNKIEELTGALEAAYRLYLGQNPRHPEFSLFRSWQQLKLLIERFPSIAAQYRPYERLVEEYKDSIPKVCRTLRNRLVDEEHAEVVVSTAHRSKGREWDRVTLAEDFTGVTLAQENPTHRCVKLYLEEANLTYVAFTRARDTLVKGAFAEVLERQKDIARALKAGKRQLCTPEIEVQARKTDPRTPGLLGRFWKRLFGG